MIFSVELSETAEKDLDSLNNKLCEMILKRLYKIRENPIHFIERLAGYTLYKLRCGDYRVILRIDTSKNIIRVIMIDHRENVYKRLQRFMNKF